MKKTTMRNFARLIARMGANVQKGQEVVIRAGLDQPEFVAMTVEECYKAGASKVRVEWGYQPVEKLAIRYRSLKSLSRFDDWEIAKMKHGVEALPAMIYIESEDPNGMKGVNQKKVSKASQALYPIQKPLRDAMENGDKAQTDACAKTLLATIKAEAKDISTKYIDPPNTTEFAIMFLPFEGLYSEVVNRGMIEVLQRDYKVNIAGPSTMAALLNSLQMGFKTLAVQKRSAEVWQVLGGVKKEFDTFAQVLENTQKKLDQANRDLDTLVGVRTRQIQRRLKDVQTPAGLTDGDNA